MALAFIAGVISVAWFPMPIQWPVLVGLACLSMASLSRSAVVTVFIMGALWCGLSVQHHLSERWAEFRQEEVLWVTGHVAGLPTWSDDLLAFDFKVHDKPPDWPATIRIRWYRPSEYIVPGQIWYLPLKLSAPSGRLNFEGFDYERYLFEHKTGGVARVDSSLARAAQRRGYQVSIGTYFHRLRQRVAENVQANTASLPVASVKRALLIGDRSRLTEDLRQTLQRTGTAHLLAISGLHIGLVASIGATISGPIWWLLTLAGARVPRRRVALLGGLILATVYVGLAAWSLPTQRAGLMLLVAIIAFWVRRRIQPFDALLYAAVLILIIHPLAVLSVGFWLSFLAVAALIWAFAWRVDQTIRSTIFALFRAQYVVGLGLLPISLGIFGYWSLTSFVANMIAIPWVSVVVLPGLMLSALLEEFAVPIPGIQWASDQCLAWLLATLTFLQQHPFGQVHADSLNWSTIVLALVGAGWILAPKGWPGRALGGILFLPMVLQSTAGKSDENLHIEVFDIGSGLAVWIEVGDYRLLYDTGPGDDEEAMIGQLVKRKMPAIATQATIHDVILSHDHSAHVGGLKSIDSQAWMARVRSTQFVGMGEARHFGDWIPCQRGQQWWAGAWQFSILHPGPYLPDLHGNSSCVLYIKGPGGSVLLTGGLDAIGEAHLLQRWPELQADVLVISKSGHSAATSDVWIQQIRPNMALISVARGDRFNRPSPEVIGRLSRHEVPVLSTAECGAIRVVLDEAGGPASLVTAASNRSGLWRYRPDCP